MKDSIEKYFDKLFPINRSLTGNGNRETLKVLSELVDIRIHEVRSGTNCFDWIVPPEWNVKEAWVKNSEGKKIRYSYRFIFVPETIGSIYYLSVNGDELRKKLIAGFVVTCIGDAGNFTYKRSRKKNTIADRTAELVLKQTESNYKVVDFFP